jgi:hypothetical protein
VNLSLALSIEEEEEEEDEVTEEKAQEIQLYYENCCPL